MVLTLALHFSSASDSRVHESIPQCCTICAAIMPHPPLGSLFTTPPQLDVGRLSSTLCRPLPLAVGSNLSAEQERPVQLGSQRHCPPPLQRPFKLQSESSLQAVTVA